MASRALIVTACFLAGCSAAYYTDQADREVSRIVTDKTVQAFGQPREFSIVPGDEFPELLEGVGEPPAAPPPSAADNLPPALPEPPADAIRLSVADALQQLGKLLAGNDRELARLAEHLGGFVGHDAGHLAVGLVRVIGGGTARQKTRRENENWFKN